MKHLVTLIPGDGIGPSISEATVRVLEAAGVQIEWDVRLAGVTALEKLGTPIPEDTLESIRTTRLALKGPLTTPVGTGFRSINVALRQEFDLYANVRPTQTLVDGKFENVDLVIVRENTEGLYCGIERYIPSGDDPHHAAESVMLVTRRGAERIIRYAFEHAVKTGRSDVVLAHKANILKYTQGLMLDIARVVAKEYEGRVTFRERIIDACAMDLVIRPESYSIIVCENLFGDILSDLAAGLVGGLGLAPAANIGESAAIFEAVHGSAPDIAGKGIANPSALILAACMMLEHLGERDAARTIRSAVTKVLREGIHTTGDMGGRSTTDQFTDAVIAAL